MSGRQFLIKAIIFIFVFVAVDFAMGKGFKALFNKVQSGTLYTSRYGFKESKDEIVILGASEVAHSYVSNQIAEGMGISCYNLGMDGFNVYFQYALLKEILKRHTPSYIILSADVVDDGGYAIAGLFPYYDNSDDVKNLILDLDKNMRVKLLLNSYKYNSLIINLIQGIMVSEPQTNGYKPLYSTQRSQKLDTISAYSRYSENSLEYYTDMLRLAGKSGADVFVVDVPKFKYVSDYNEQYVMKDLTTKENVRFLSFVNDTTYLNNPGYFRDGTHLNDTGARIFSGMIIDSLVNYTSSKIH